MGRKRKSKVNKGGLWEDLRKEVNIPYAKTWKHNPKCPDNTKRYVKFIEETKKQEEKYNG